MDVSSHSLYLLQQLNVQREFGFLCDCTVAIGNVYFKAHRAVLAAFSNYFKMIFIHQTSECIKIQPTDIQPDVFSYLLHIMYTGMGPKQPVDRSRLQEGIKFLHAYQLCHKPGEAGPDATSDLRMSNLYGIQISSQLPNKDGTGLKLGGQRDPEESRSSGRAEWAERSHARSSQAVGLEGISSDHQPPGMRPLSSVASGDDSDISTRIKEERLDDEEQEQEQAEGDMASLPPPAPRSSHSPAQGHPCQPTLALLCPRCGERCLSPEGLQEHLISHAACSLEPLMEGTPSENTDLGGPVGAEEHLATRERLDAGCLEEALRQSQALADEIAAELRRGGGPGGVGIGGFTGSPPMVGLFTRKRKMACAVCNQRFSHKSQLQEHMFSHVGKTPRHQHQRYNRFCNQLLQVACEGMGDGTQGAGAGPGEGSVEESGAAQDNGSSCYSLDSEVSRESVDAVAVE
ncbi:zinc finger and BTB domain-containing protein 25 [Clupea harengus]|uniref:Zinc finger and BTB domain-containing protein 25 n=1 Tax=Clupea harengus TaxID=7950 RepID=A0A6P3VRE6_CLUHA|nr:zinc finger and BTB domain-containing protein 25 [Clupea harengus]XP_031437479.1 zinc finger and BTB domain-containing protein 25 [Clupea harengus]